MLNDVVWILVCLQIAMGAADTVVHHEFTERLAWRRSQAQELRLHGVRNLFYAGIFAVIGLTAPTGIFAAGLLVALYAELIITLWDFVEEDRTRALPPTERVLHTLLALNYGAILMGATPALLQAAQQPTALQFMLHGFWTLPCLVAIAGTIIFGLRDLAAAARWKRIVRRPAAELLPAGGEPRHVLVTGGTGFIGARLIEALVARGDDVTVLARSPARAARLALPLRIVTSLDQLRDDARIDAIVNLAGQPVAGFFWTARYRRRLLRSRLQVTRDVLQLIARLARKPSVLVSGSAIGVYGVSPGEPVNETTRIAVDGSFAQRLCQDWERAAERSAALGMRTVLLRIGLVLDTEGGSFAQMLPAFEYGVGGPFGRGRNWMSWISRDDLVRMIDHAIREETISGALNGVAPAPVRNLEFARATGAALRRPAAISLPETLLKAGLGDLAREIFLGDQRVLPHRALESGFLFLDPDLGHLLRRLVGTRAGKPMPEQIPLGAPRLSN